nr:hypothetical protein [Tanacetum cinerariifolium]
ALIAEKTNVSRSKEKVVVSLDSEGSEADDFNELKKITALLAKAFNRIKFYSKPTNNNLRTSSSYQSANKKQEFVKTNTKKVEKKDDEKKRDMSRQTSSLKPYVLNVILEKIIIDLEDEVVNLLEKEKVNLETIESLKSKSFESSEKVNSESENQSENDCLVVEKECVKEENPKVIAPEMFKLNVSQCVSPILMSKSRKNLLACNNSHLGETSSAYVCNNAMNVSCNPRMCDLLDDNNFFIFDDVNVRISPVSKMPFRKKPCDSMLVRSKSNSNKSLPRTVHM